MRCAIYARVSTKDHGQDVDNQLIQLRQFAANQGWQLVHEYIDHASAKGTNGRTEFLQMFQDAENKQFDVLLVWALDRLSREGIIKTSAYIERLQRAQIKFHSLTEPQFSGPAGDLLLAVFAWIAKQERLRISERTCAGIARKRGMVLDSAKINELHTQGLSARQIARQFSYRHAGRLIVPRRAVNRLIHT